MSKNVVECYVDIENYNSIENHFKDVMYKKREAVNNDNALPNTFLVEAYRSEDTGNGLRLRYSRYENQAEIDARDARCAKYLADAKTKKNLVHVTKAELELLTQYRNRK